MQDITQRFERIEDRLAAIEQKLGITKTVAAPAIDPIAQSVTPPVKPAAQPASMAPTPVRVKKPTADEPESATRLMAWCAGFTFILAMTYFLKLVYDSGWLTPVRQIGLAYLACGGLIAAGFYVKVRDRQYGAYLPAIGLVVLYLTTFTGQLYYDLFDRQQATVIVGIITLFGIWLGRKFENSMYVLFSAVGVYITPLLIHSDHGSLMDLVMYYSAWSLLFSFCAIVEARRITYLLPMYLAMLGFDIVWRSSGADEWVLAVSYQLIQFAIFSLATVAFSITHQKPINNQNSLAHGVALFIFYGIEYALLKQHAPEWVNYIAILSAVAVYLLFLLTSKIYKGSSALEHGATLVSCYCSWVAVHAVFFGIVSTRYFPWAAMLTPIIFVLVARQFGDNKKALFPITVACGALSFIAYYLLLFGIFTHQHTDVPLPAVVLFAYVVMLYGMYYHFSQAVRFSRNAVLALYAGHLALIAAMIEVIERDIYLSALWAFYAVILLVVAMRIKDKALGQSALLIFAAAGLKVLLFDLDHSNSMLKVVVLLALSVSLYIGGWLYQSLVRSTQAART